MIFISLLFFLIPAFFGIAALLALRAFEEKTEVALIGGFCGIALNTAVSFFLSIFAPSFFIFGVLPLVVCFLAGLWLLLWKKNYQRFKELTFDRTVSVLVLVSLVFFGIISSKLLIVKDDGLYTGIVNAFGDVAWHVSNITRFSESTEFPPQNPIFARTQLNYPFLINYFSSLLVRSGASIRASVIMPPIFFIPALLGLLYVFAKKISGKKAVGVLTVLLFIFGGATLGFTRFSSDFQKSNVSFVRFVTHLPDRDYSGVGNDTEGFHFLNPATTLLLPQRPILFGIPLALSILLLLLEAVRRQERKEILFFAAGILAGILPFIHAHSVLALLPVVVALFFFHRHMAWSVFFFFSILVGLPQVLYFFSSAHEAGSFLRWDPGWTAEENIFLFWLKNTGFFIPVVLAGFFWRGMRLLKIFAISAAALFLASNLWLFAPWAWDNYKIFVYWFLFSLPLFASMLFMVYEKKMAALKILIVLLALFQSLSAVIDLWKIALPTSPKWIEWNKEGIEAANEAKKMIGKNEVVLTAPIHNTPMFLVGRLVYLGYPAHVWSHGGNPWERERIAKEFFEGRSQFLSAIQPNYVWIGPNERAHYPGLVIRPEWSKVFEQNGYQLFKIY